MNCLLFELCKFKESQICLVCFQLGIVFIALLLGMWLVLRPQKAIQIQIAFYRLINWKIEPLSMAKEIKNTRIMGATVVALGVISLIYIIMQRIS